MRRTGSSKLTAEEEMLLQMEEPPEFLVEGAYQEFTPDPEAERVARFLTAAAAAGLVKPVKKAPGTYKYGETLLDPEKFLQDFAGVSEDLWEFRGLLQEMSQGAEVVRSRILPRIDAKQATDKLGGRVKLVEIPVLAGYFRIAVRYYAEKQVAALFAVDLNSNKICSGSLECLRAVAGAESKAATLKSFPKEALKKGLETLRKAALEHAEGLFNLARAEVIEERSNRRAAMEGYFEGLEEEYAKDERRMFYHLYYYEQQEKLAAKRQADLAERQALVEGEERYYQIETEIRPEGLALFLLPVYRCGKKSLCALSGRTL
jgi:hypothetical protein